MLAESHRIFFCAQPIAGIPSDWVIASPLGRCYDASMGTHGNPLYWSISLGTYFQTRVRVSVFFPLIVLVLCFRLHDEQIGISLGLWTSLVLFVSVLLHEFGHVFAARRTGGSAGEILIWPLGGLAEVRPADSSFSRLITPLAGPAVNLVLCLLTVLTVWERGFLAEAVNPLVMPDVRFQQSVLGDVMVVVFAVNWMLILVNLVPVFPLDGGRFLQVILSSRLGSEAGRDVYVKVGTICAVLVLIAGLIGDWSGLVFIGAIVLVLNFQESIRFQMGQDEESFMGYDFSRGYSSLEDSSTFHALDSGPAKRPGFLTRWRERRREVKNQMEQERERAVEMQMDQILEKVHRYGMESLSREERSALQAASAKLKRRSVD